MIKYYARYVSVYCDDSEPPLPSGREKGDAAKRGDFRPPHLMIPEAAGGGPSSQGANPPADAELPSKPVAAQQTRGMSELESVLSASKVHMGAGQIIPNARDAPPASAGGTTLGMGAIKVSVSMLRISDVHILVCLY